MEVRSSPGPQVVRVRITERGFVPDRLTLSVGRPVRLEFLRESGVPGCRVSVPGLTPGSLSVPMGRAAPLEFIPRRPGVYFYECEGSGARGYLTVR
ncbi:MAG: cupredoxin domain-containing protein [Candidatus Eremiobacterota bacterium]